MGTAAHSNDSEKIYDEIKEEDTCMIFKILYFIPTTHVEGEISALFVYLVTPSQSMIIEFIRG